MKKHIESIFTLFLRRTTQMFTSVSNFRLNFLKCNAISTQQSTMNT